MNERVPDSTGLPLRAIVMVLLFLGVLFLLLGIFTVGSGSDTSAQSTTATTASTQPSTATTTPPPARERPEVHVYNNSDTPRLAGNAVEKLTPAGWNAILENDKIALPEGLAPPVVLFTDSPGEKQFADEVANVLGIDVANVVPRKPELGEAPPGIIVVIAG